MTHHILILAATTLLLLSLSPLTTTATTTAVLDIQGRPLRGGSNYHILPVIRGRGGGLTISSKNDSKLCPLYVAQESHEVSNGLPLKLYSVNPREKIISVSTDLNFIFDTIPVCVKSFTWELTIEEETGRRYVGLGGRTGNPGLETVSNWFKIEKAGSGKFDYKIVFCPSVCNYCKVLCGDVGVFVEDDGKRFLGFSDQPLLVMFKKA